MPKMKTKSGAKKRFRVTGTGKILHNHAYKRHGMSKDLETCFVQPEAQRRFVPRTPKSSENFYLIYRRVRYGSC